MPSGTARLRCTCRSLLIGTLPWLPLLLRELWQRRVGFIERVRANDEARLLACWFVLPLVVFVFARSRLPLYLLPLFVPLAVMIARTLAPLDIHSRSRQALLIAWCVLLVILRAVPAYIDTAVDDGALARALCRAASGVAQRSRIRRYRSALRLALLSRRRIERLELPGFHVEGAGAGHQSEMREHEGCRVLLVND